MIPVIALVGRPNVGKSTLFNRLTRSRDALVANLPGLTRDRKYGEGKVEDKPFIVIDTGGISGEEEGIDTHMASQSLAAIAEADLVFLLVDARAGLTAGDENLVTYLRQQGRAFFLVVNKTDGASEEVAMAEFYALGVENMHPIAASQGRGVVALMEVALADYEVPIEEEDDESDSIRVAIVGRPNVGKSTLVNRLLGEQRVVVFDQPGTTRDSIYIDFEREGKLYTLIDTAGIRKRKNIKEVVEKFSIVKTLKAIDDAHVVVLVMDASVGLVEQDLHLLGQAIDAGRGLVIALNKWDGLETDDKEHIKHELKRRLQFVDYAEIHFISALHGTGVGNLYKSIDQAHYSATLKLATNALTRVLEDAVKGHEPPLVNGRRIKLRYAHAGGKNPPLIIIHGNQTGSIPASYTRYLENFFRDALDLKGTPVRVEYRSGDNPFATKRDKLTDRQASRKRRLTLHAGKNRRS